MIMFARTVLSRQSLPSGTFRTLNSSKALCWLAPANRSYTLPAGTAEPGIQERITKKPLASRKTFLIDSYKHLMETNPVVLFVHYNNLLKHEDHHYRAQIQQNGGKLTMLRNNLFEVYLKNSHIPDPCAPVKSADQNKRHPLLPLFKGPTAAISFPETNPADVAKVLKVLEKAQDKLFVVAAKVETAVYDVAQLAHFKSLPSKLDLQGQLLGVLHVLSGAGLVRTLEADSQLLYLTLSRHNENQCSTESKDK